MTATTPSTTLPGWTHAYSGKVRDLYVPQGAASVESADTLLVVASDRVSAFDFVLEPGIPGKGELLTTLTNRVDAGLFTTTGVAEGRAVGVFEPAQAATWSDWIPSPM